MRSLLLFCLYSVVYTQNFCSRSSHCKRSNNSRRSSPQHKSRFYNSCIRVIRVIYVQELTIDRMTRILPHFLLLFLLFENRQMYERGRSLGNRVRDVSSKVVALHRERRRNIEHVRIATASRRPLQ
ncbi:hypothetical protein PRIPAC_71932, partial [Pristionchus pacificus]|uniref:Uncharacterized protein n=1 Tax=Pristionchus pacificus TaxID=54126 RepID=A0A2A6C188_PRIPA